MNSYSTVDVLECMFLRSSETVRWRGDDWGGGGGGLIGRGVFQIIQ